MQHIQGWVENGNTKVSVSGLLSTTLTQKSFPLATVTVYNSGTVNPATIFSDNLGTALGNPFTANADGTWGFYAAAGQYDVVFSGTGISAPFTLFALGESISTLIGPSYISACDALVVGSDASTRIASAIALLPITGGTVDARCLFGSQAWSTNPFAGLSPSKPVYLLLGVGTTTISLNVTVPRNVTIAFSQGSILSTTGVTLNVIGQIAAERYKIFAGTTPPAMSGAIAYAYPEWFGALADGVTDDWLACQMAEDSLVSGALLNTIQVAPAGTVLFGSGTYSISAPLSTCHFNGCPGDVGRGVPAGTINACITLRGVQRGSSVIFASGSIDMIQMYNWSCPSAVEDLYLASSGTSVGIRVHGNQTSLRRNWLLVDHGIIVESTGTIDTGFTTIEDCLCDAPQLGGGPGCITITQTGGGTGNPSPNYIQITNQSCFGGAWCVQSDKIFDSRIDGLTHDGPGTYAISLTNATNVAITNVNATGANINQSPSEHGLEIINSVNVVASNIILRNFPASAVFVSASTGVVISDFAFTDNVQTNGAPNPYDITLLRSDVIVKGGYITNNSGHPVRAILFAGVTDGNYVIDGVTIKGSKFTSTLIEGQAGLGGIISAKLVNIFSDSPWVSGSLILIGACGALDVTNVRFANSPTTWLESTYQFTNQCLAGNIADGGNILLNAVSFDKTTVGCFNGANPISAGQFNSLIVAGAIQSGSRITAKQLWLANGSTPAGDGFTSPGSTTVGALPSAVTFFGQFINVTDSTTVSAEGQPCVGGSTNLALAWSNGVIWKCF